MIFILGFFLYSIGASATQLDFIADFTTTQNSLFKKTLIGGLSGLYYKDSLIWAVSDDRGQNNEPRVYSFKILGNSLVNSSGASIGSAPSNSSTMLSFKVIPKEVIFLKVGQPTEPLKRIQIDAESLVSFKKGWLISSEGDYNSVPRKVPSLIYFDSQGQFVREINWPEKFSPNLTGKQKKGLRGNYAFEGLSISPDQEYLYAIHEAPIVQENKAWHAGAAGKVHLLRFKIPLDSEKIEVEQEILYSLDTYKKNNGKILASGVSELLAISSDKVLVLERAVFFNSVDFLRYESKIYEVSFKNPLTKKLVLDLTDIKKMLKTTKELDNFEGMALGPIVNKQPTLLMVSDDNFNPLENTIWLLFKIK